MEEFRDLAVNNQAELDRIKAGAMSSRLYNEDLGADRAGAADVDDLQHSGALDRDVHSHHDLPAAAGLMAPGMNWWQALLTISLGQHPRSYPYAPERPRRHQVRCPLPGLRPRLLRGEGANFAAIARALVACGWFGIQTWLGGAALDALVTAAWGGWANVPGHTFIAFLVFWLYSSSS